MTETYDVIVAGAGNAALCAALSAREQGASVLVLERAPEHFRGGNTYFTGGGFRFPYEGIDDIRRLIPDLSEAETAAIDVGAYPSQQMYADMMRVSEGLADDGLIDLVVQRAYPTMCWMRDRGVRWVLQYGRQAFESGGVRRFWGGLITECVGGGKGLSDALFAIAERAGIEVLYEAKATDLRIDATGRGAGLVCRTPEGRREIEARSVVLACGGFEANAEMRARYLGAGWELAKVRGTQFNTGDGIRMALDAGAMSYGHWSGCHAVAWDLNAPPYGNRNIGDLYQKHSYPFGIVVNVDGDRFVDEGADFRNYTYARYGREILRQPHRAAFQIFDAKVAHLLRDEYRIRQVSKAEADSVDALADALGIDRSGLVRTVQAFNAAVQAGEFDPTVLDGKRTEGVEPPKSNWALPIDTPPYAGYAVTCGITFTFGGLRIDESARVLDGDERPIRGLYAAGELVGGLFYFNYAGGSGLMAGSVFGRIAGASAGVYAADSRGEQ
ncbi:MAG: FAD-dependent tricarballylate dehydrogenase TcuA [Dehalococcoidia bacterium]